MRLASVLTKTVLSVFSTGGATLTALFIALQLLATILEDSTISALQTSFSSLASIGPAPLATTTSIPILIIGFIAYLLITLTSSIGAYRTLDDQLKTEHFTSNMAWALLNYILGSLIFTIAYGIIIFFVALTALLPVLLILTIPLGFAAATYIYTAFYTWPAHVTLYNKNIVDAALDAYQATQGRRLQTLGYIIAFHASYLLVSMIIAIPVVMYAGPIMAVVEAIGVGLLLPYYYAFTVKLHGALSQAQTS